MDALKGKNAWTVKIGEKGQFVIPKEAREMFDIHPGDTILVLGDAERGIAIPPKAMMDRYISMIFGEMNMGGQEDDGQRM
ncbi:MAG: AbrB/MazE/SpoVT family DNA-binding domain-containing protein [Roseburia sp.]|nr:AbrB/MazE/SpoVT family DNA-binding domain-containing protein [Roseburia sp.]